MPPNPFPQPLSDASASGASLRVPAASLLQLLDISPDALLVVDHNGAIVMLNEQAAALFGYSREELQGQPLERLLPEGFPAAHVGHRQDYFAAPRTFPMERGLQVFGQRKDGTEFPVDIRLRPLLLNDQPVAIAAIRDVSEQQHVNRERIQQIGLQTELINWAHDAILIRDPISRIIFWNRGAEELYGWTAQEAQGRLTYTLLEMRSPRSRADIDAQIEQEGAWEGELTQTRRDGRPVIVESRQVMVRDEQGHPSAIVEINRDISERRRLEQAEHAETATRLTFFQQVLDALPTGVSLVYGTDARLMLANRATTSVWGAQWQVDQPMLDFLATNGIDIFDTQGYPLTPEKFATLRAVQKGETVLQHQEMIHQPDGVSLPVLVNALPLPAQHRPKASKPVATAEPVALVVHQNVTTLKEAEYLKDEFVGIVAHELRTPLAALRGFADMLLVQTERGHGPSLADWQKEALEEIGLATGRLVHLTEELLDVTRLQAGRLLLHCTPTNVVALARRSAALLQQTTTLHQVEVRTTHTELVAEIDPGRIDQVLTNLIGNAIKYSPQGGPVSISLWQEHTTRTVGISVQDRGIGIPRHQQAQVFGRFMRGENAQAEGISGTGLGLYLCRELVERHGGHLWFESEEGARSTFFLTLPLSSTTREQAGEAEVVRT